MKRKIRHHSPPMSDDVRGGLAPQALSRQEFGRRLSSLMLAKEWNQSELGRAAGIGRDSISTYINGKTWPTPLALSKLSKALGVTPEELLPNAIAEAMEVEHPAFSVREAVGHPDRVWLTINQAVPFGVATDIMALLKTFKSAA